MCGLVRLIINADDLGISREVNRLTFELMAAGKVSSATLLANGPAAEEAAESALEFPHCSFGVHLNVTRFASLTASSGFENLLNSGGEFAGNARTLRLNARQRRAVYEEWCCQIRKVQGLGVSPSHLDSHDYVHAKPELFFVLKKVQRAFGIRKVRISRNIFLPGRPVGPVLRFKKWLWNSALRHFYHTRTTQGFCSLATFVEVAQHKQVGCDLVEVGVHPGNPLFAKENALLETPWQDQLAVRTDIISYHEV